MKTRTKSKKVNKAWFQDHVNDPYVKQAKRDGYRARAAYKLKEKHGAKVEEKKSELIKKLDEKLGGEGAAEKAKDTLRSLFKKKEEKPE